MPAKVLMPPGNIEGGRSEYRLNRRCLPGSDLNQHMPRRRKVRRGMGCYDPVTVEAIGSSHKRKPWVEVPDVKTKPFNLSLGDIGWV